jgi:hypothetical protein
MSHLRNKAYAVSLQCEIYRMGGKDREGKDVSATIGLINFLNLITVWLLAKLEAKRTPR